LSSRRRWRARNTGDDRLSLQLAQRLGVPELIARLLAAREIAADEADRFLKPTLRDWLPDPSHLLDMEKAVERNLRERIETDPKAPAFIETVPGFGYTIRNNKQ